MKIKKNIKRLLLYRLCLVKFKEMGFKKVYSYNLGHEAGVSAEQIRKDFSQFGITGNKKGGYDIEYLLERLNHIFKKNEHQKVIIVGMGNMGYALSHYECGFTETKKYIVAGFDIDPMKIKMTYNIPVFPMNVLRTYIREHNIRIAILAVPAISAQEVCAKLVVCGIKGIMNFSPVILQVPDDVIVNNVNLCDELECIMHMVDPVDNPPTGE
ncbi:MAG: redox-sensing transcriptional repressor Rex [Cytophagales bacterium]|nr:redox-sensing transcriptional repressor Rex [Cytophagales bacterium]